MPILKNWTIAAFVCFTLLIPSAQAAFDGSWSGDLNYSAPAGVQETWQCSLHMSSDSQTLALVDSHHCFFLPPGDEVIFEKQDSTLIYKGPLGPIQGTLIDNNLVLTKKSERSESKLSLQLQEDGSLSILETFHLTLESGETYSSQTSGRMSPAP